jgi:PAS domain S-box-containing protein
MGRNAPVKLGLGLVLCMGPALGLAGTVTGVPGGSVPWIGVALLALLCLLLLARRRRLNRQASGVVSRFDAHTDGSRGPERTALSPIDAVHAEIDRLRCSLEALRTRRQDELSQRRAAEIGLRQLEERYGLALRGADDALWEWDLRSDQARFSPRWKSLLGCAEEELAEGIDAWWDRVHPDDHEGVMVAVRDHLEGRTARLETEHRLRHRDGTWRWVKARGSLVADGAGVPVRMVGLVSDITPRKRMQEAVIELAEGLSALSGDECLRKLVRSFASVLGVREAFVCECTDQPTTRVRMLARWNAGEYARCVEFDLSGTACEDVIRDGRTVFAPNDAGERWALEKQYQRFSYLGIPCLDSAGRVIGHIACADDKPMREELPHQAILKIFAMRAAIELERSAIERIRPLSALPLIAALAQRRL